MNRRQFNRAALLGGGAALFEGTLSRLGDPPKAMAQGLPQLPDPASSGIDHIVSVTMENRSFDHFFGWLPNANGMQAGLTYLDPQGVAHARTLFPAIIPGALEPIPTTPIPARGSNTMAA